ncbi:MAG: MOSC domain-containing protein [Bacteroidota bacterium]
MFITTVDNLPANSEIQPKFFLKIAIRIMQIVSVNVGKPQNVLFQGKEISTGIFKSPVEETVMVRKLNVDGDEQADLRVHGGVEKAVYAYPHQHYAGWQQDFPQHEFPIGVFGENLTVDSLDKTTVHIGDRFQSGDCELQVTQPRFPCFKLGIRFGYAPRVTQKW